MTAVYIGLGSNIDQPLLQIRNALAALGELPETMLIQDSGYYVSTPMGPEDQPDFVNAVAEINTGLGAFELLERCQRIEQQQGRIRQRHWGERSIDLDILLYGEQCIDTADLVVPHPGVTQRDFVYLPLLKLNPDIVLPGTGELKAIVASADEETKYDCQFAGKIG